jgi:hypothetical protein
MEKIRRLAEKTKEDYSTAGPVMNQMEKDGSHEDTEDQTWVLLITTHWQK